MTEQNRQDEYRSALTDYGFKWGPAEIIRAASDPKHGVWLIVRGGKEEVTIRVTRSGLLRVGDVGRKQMRMIDVVPRYEEEIQ